MENNKIKKLLIKETWLLGVLSAISFALSVFRVIETKTFYYMFLNWNLFLAGISWVLTAVLLLNSKLGKNKIILALTLGIWLLFFPNAPYILTGLFHLRDTYTFTMPIWYDLILILFYAWTGLMLGFLSLSHLEKLLKPYLKTNKAKTLLAISVFFLAGFGVYVGRYLRWNSWDILHQPTSLFQDILVRVFNPFQHPHTWGMTISLGVFLLMVYWSIKHYNLKDYLE